jgi:hypothetical protein
MKIRTEYIPPTRAQREFLLWIKLTHPDFLPVMKRKNSIPRHEPTEAEIQHAAYLLWIESGRPAGRDLEHWHAAREMLCHRHGRDSKTRQQVPELAASTARF